MQGGENAAAQWWQVLPCPYGGPRGLASCRRPRSVRYFRNIGECVWSTRAMPDEGTTADTPR